jgi:hypothetical protein
MEKSNMTSLLYLHNISSSLKRLNALNQKNRSNRVALLVLLLVMFAAAVFSLTVVASGITRNPGADGTAKFAGAISDGQESVVADDPRLGVPGTLLADSSMLSDQKAGSLLIFPVYTSRASFSNLENTRVSITNIDPERSASIHLFLVDGATCSVSDAYICLTASQTASFLMADLDPGITGYIIAVAVDANGCPTIFNGLIGDVYVKFATVHAANLGAVAVAGLPGLNKGECNTSSTTAQLNFDGVSYNMLPRVVAADNLLDRASRNEMLLILDRIGGDLTTGAARLGPVFGLLFDDAETPLSFSFNPDLCQFRAMITNGFPRTTPRYDQVIPAGRSGWMKLWSFNDAALIGALINFNPNHTSSSGAFNQGHNLHTLTLTNTAALTIPVFPPAC